MRGLCEKYLLWWAIVLSLFCRNAAREAHVALRKHKKDDWGLVRCNIFFVAIISILIIYLHAFVSKLSQDVYKLNKGILYHLLRF